MGSGEYGGCDRTDQPKSNIFHCMILAEGALSWFGLSMMYWQKETLKNNFRLGGK